MEKIRAKCIVPHKYAEYAWPDTFEVLPRVGDRVRCSGPTSQELMVTRVVHANHEKMHQPPTNVTRIELHCEEIKNPLMG
jgi:hypothetical protein